jgi:hypothetical protein
VTQTETNLTAERPPRRPPGTTYWLITNGRRDVLTLYYGGEEMLPVFSHLEEAEMFLRLGILGYYDWRASESGARELVSFLCGPCADVRNVALDPLPEMVADRSLGLVSLCRERFLRHITQPEGDYLNSAYRSEGTSYA